MAYVGFEGSGGQSEGKSENNLFQRDIRFMKFARP